VKKSNIILLGTSVIIVILASIFASSLPDGLESVAQKMNFSGRATSIKTLFKDYSFFTGCIGVVMCLMVGCFLRLSFKVSKK
jgi:hypothetical protein